MDRQNKALQGIISREIIALAKPIRYKIFKACCLTETTGQRTVTNGLTFELFELVFSLWKLTKTIPQSSLSPAKDSIAKVIKDTSTIPEFIPYLGRGVVTPQKKRNARDGSAQNQNLFLDSLTKLSQHQRKRFSSREIIPQNQEVKSEVLPLAATCLSG